MTININGNNPSQNLVRDELLQAGNKGEAEKGAAKLASGSVSEVEVSQPAVSSGSIKTSSAAESVLARLKEQMSGDGNMAMLAQAGSISRELPSLI